MDVWRRTSHLEGERETTRKIERVRRWSGVLERWLKTDRSICHHRTDEQRRVSWTEEWERERQSERERRRDTKRDGEGFRGHNNDKMTRGWSKHGSCLSTGEGERERWQRVWRQRVDSRLKGHSVYGGRRRDWGILMWGGRREMRRDSSGWREGLWLWKEKGMMKQRRDRNERESGRGETDP